MYAAVGVDMGLDGGAVMVNGTSVLSYFSTPSRRVKIRKLTKSAKKNLYDESVKKVYSADMLVEQLVQMRDLALANSFNGIAVIVEDYTIRTGLSSPKSYISTGGCVQSWQDALAQLDIPFFMVAPITWKSDLDLNSDKDFSLKTLATLFTGNVPADVATDHNLAEAAMIGWWFEHHQMYRNLLNESDPRLHSRKQKNKAAKPNKPKRNPGVQGP